MERFRNGSEQIAAARELGHEVEIGNPELPIKGYLHEIYESVQDNVFTVLISETGSGKTTQTPQILFANGKTVEHTQPRRTAAHEAAKRIGEELSASIPNLDPGTVAVHTGEESTITPATRVTVLTDGMFLAANYNPERNALETSRPDQVVIIDEVHEWNKSIEVALGLLMKESLDNPDLRVVLMTATLNEEFLVQRLREITNLDANVINVPGRSYPITREERPEMTSASMALELLEPGKGIMVFKQGIGEILDTIKKIKTQIPTDLKDKVQIFPFHSSYSSKKLSEACNYEQPDDGCKIVVGTNAMESSLTVSGIHYVVDDGLAREVHTDKRGSEGLFSTPIPQSRVIQRAGRAGRLGPGSAYLVRADDETPFVPFDEREAFGAAEIQRLDLKKEVLHLAAIGLDLEQLPIVNRIDPLSLSRAKMSLNTIGALDDDWRITEIGLEMNRYPVRAQLMRAIVESQKYSPETQSLIAAMSAAVEAGGLPQYGRFGNNDWKTLTNESSSDLLAQLDLFIAANHMTPSDQHEIGINPKTVDRANETYEKILHQLKLERQELSTPNDLQHEEMIRCIYAGYVEFIYRRMGRTTFQLLDDNEPVQYKISDRSVVDPRVPKLVVGTPYVVERYRKGKLEEVPIIESVTELPFLADLGEAATKLAQWSEEVVWRGGRAFTHSEQSVRGTKTGVAEDKNTSRDDVETLRNDLIIQAFEQPGAAQLELRAIKKELEQLNHLSREKINLFTQQALFSFVSEAANRVDELDVYHLDSELRLIMQERGITRQSFLSDDEIDRIIDDAPSEIIVDDEIFDVEYRNGYPKIKKWRPEQLSLIDSEDIHLPDGRSVRFVYEKREYTLSDLRTKLTDK